MSVEKKSEVSRRAFLAGLGASATIGALASGAAAGDTEATRRGPPAKVRIGIVGGGFGRTFQWHLDPDCEVVAVCDVRDERLELLKTTYGCSNGYKDYKQFLTHAGMNAVGVFTPAPFHAGMALQAFAAGKHVISAVPAGMSVEELERILDAVKRTGLHYMMAETSRYRAEIMACVELAREGRFGTIFYTESEYHHTGLAPYAYGPGFDCQSCDYIHTIDKVRDGAALVDTSKLQRTWSYGYPPMLYPTHCTGMIVPVTGERLTEVTAHGWGDGSEMLRENYYDNPFFHTVALFKTTKGHSSRVSIGWHIAAQGTERAVFYGDRMSYIMERPEGSPNTIVEQKEAPPFGIYTGVVESRVAANDRYSERLPEAMRVDTHHGGSHAFITHEFVRAIMEDRRPQVDIHEAIAYNLPGIVAQQSAKEGGRTLKIRDYGRGPG